MPIGNGKLNKDILKQFSDFKGHEYFFKEPDFSTEEAAKSKAKVLDKIKERSKIIMLENYEVLKRMKGI